MSPFHSWYWLWKGKVKESVAQSCLTPCNPMDCSPPGSAVHGILQARSSPPGSAVHGILQARSSPLVSAVHGIRQARRLEWVAIPFSRRSSWPKDWTRSPALQADFYLISLPSEPAGSPDTGYNKPLFEYLACQQGRLSWVTQLLHVQIRGPWMPYKHATWPSASQVHSRLTNPDIANR